MALALPHSIFFHIPKTGGSWVRRAIVNAGIPANEVMGQNFYDKRSIHTVLDTLYHAFPVDVHAHGKFRFTFVRHPLTWYQSMWAHHAHIGWSSDYYSRPYTFGAFVEHTLNMRPAHLSLVYRFYGDVEYIGRTETLADDLVHALRMAGEEFDEARLRATPRINELASLSPWKEQCEYTPELTARVTEAEREAFERFGYTQNKDLLSVS